MQTFLILHGPDTHVFQSTLYRQDCLWGCCVCVCLEVGVCFIFLQIIFLNPFVWHVFRLCINCFLLNAYFCCLFFSANIVYEMNQHLYK